MENSKRFFGIIGILVILVILAIGGIISFTGNGSSNGFTTLKFSDSNASLNAEIAKTEEEIRRGLMYRKKLYIDEGMIFVFPNESKRSFWMKNTLIPLDILFVNTEGKIVNIEEAFPELNTSDENLTSYRSEEPTKYVIETNASFVEKNEIQEGDKIEIPTEISNLNK